MTKEREQDLKENVMQRLLKEIDRQMFPGGAEEELRQVTELFDMFHARYPLGAINETLRYSLSQMLLNGSDKQTIVDSIINRPDNRFSTEDAGVIYDYAIACNKRLGQLYGNNI